ncbi:MAG: pyruvate kinase [Chloroflexi bacterium]|nr:MAG: pyruvate kinase [Chloroflexota bacterium]
MVKSQIEGKRTKIVATLGPASWDKETVRQMMRAGMNVARINFSHGEHERHAKTIAIVREVAEEEGLVVAIMADIQGPKIRLGVVANEPVTIKPGDTIVLTEDDVPGENGVYQLPHPEFIRDIKAGDPLLLDDGNLEFVVREARPKSLVCEVVIGGEISSRKGVMAPSSHLTLPAITEKDREDIEFALEHHVDYIAMSFVRSVEDIQELKWLIRHLGGDAAIIAKIEKHEALENLEKIIAATDGIMVARGDLGLETPAEQVPYQQKRIIQLCNEAGKPVITATQMLSSMVDSPRPTRAEASDVYNAIVDGTDAVMLSNETAVGKYPVRAVETMATIAVIAEQQLWEEGAPRWRSHDINNKTSEEIISDAISEATSRIAQMLNPKAIVTSTMTGYTARRVARERTKTPIICVTPNGVTYRRMALVWGVIPLLVPEFNTIDEMISTIVRAAYNEGLVEVGDMLVIIAGVPFGIGGQTNLLKIQRVGESGEI